MATFQSLNGRDFTRLGFTTKMIKTIEKIQAQYNRNEAKGTEEWLDDTMMVEADQHDQEPASEPAEMSRRIIDETNPYEGISLEKVLNLAILCVVLSFNVCFYSRKSISIRYLIALTKE